MTVENVALVRTLDLVLGVLVALLVWIQTILCVTFGYVKCKLHYTRRVGGTHCTLRIVRVETGPTVHHPLAKPRRRQKPLSFNGN